MTQRRRSNLQRGGPGSLVYTDRSLRNLCGSVWGWGGKEGETQSWLWPSCWSWSLRVAVLDSGCQENSGSCSLQRRPLLGRAPVLLLISHHVCVSQKFLHLKCRYLWKKKTTVPHPCVYVICSISLLHFVTQLGWDGHLGWMGQCGVWTLGEMSWLLLGDQNAPGNLEVHQEELWCQKTHIFTGLAPYTGKNTEILSLPPSLICSAWFLMSKGKCLGCKVWMF